MMGATWSSYLDPSRGEARANLNPSPSGTEEGIIEVPNSESSDPPRSLLKPFSVHFPKYFWGLFLYCRGKTDKCLKRLNLLNLRGWVGGSEIGSDHIKRGLFTVAIIRSNFCFLILGLCGASGRALSGNLSGKFSGRHIKDFQAETCIFRQYQVLLLETTFP